MAKKQFVFRKSASNFGPVCSISFILFPRKRCLMWGGVRGLGVGSAGVSQGPNLGPLKQWPEPAHVTDIHQRRHCRGTVKMRWAGGQPPGKRDKAPICLTGPLWPPRPPCLMHLCLIVECITSDLHLSVF